MSHPVCGIANAGDHMRAKAVSAPPAHQHRPQRVQMPPLAPQHQIEQLRARGGWPARFVNEVGQRTSHLRLLAEADEIVRSDGPPAQQAVQQEVPECIFGAEAVVVSDPDPPRQQLRSDLARQALVPAELDAVGEVESDPGPRSLVVPEKKVVRSPPGRRDHREAERKQGGVDTTDGAGIDEQVDVPAAREGVGVATQDEPPHTDGVESGEYSIQERSRSYGRRARLLGVRQCSRRWWPVVGREPVHDITLPQMDAFRWSASIRDCGSKVWAGAHARSTPHGPLAAQPHPKPTGPLCVPPQMEVASSCSTGC